MDDSVSFLDEVRHHYPDEFGAGPAIEEVISFLSASLELARREYTWHVFKICRFCSCNLDVLSKLPDVSLGSITLGATNADLSCIFETIQEYLLSCHSEGKFFTKPESIPSCLEFLEMFRDKALQTLGVC